MKTTKTPKPERTTSVNKTGDGLRPEMKSNVNDRLPYSVPSEDSRQERSFF